MWRLFKLLAVLLALGFVGLVGYAYLGDMSPQSGETTTPVILDVD
ncbi:MAG: hypothetical protein WDA25_06475 [Paracoccaceae bacterium]